MTPRIKTQQERRERALDFLIEDVITAFDNGATHDEIRERFEAAMIVVTFAKAEPR